MKIHICLVSAQALANLIPALMERPDKVWLVSSDEMSARKLDRRLKRLFDREHIAAEVRTGAPDAGMSSIQEFAFALAAEVTRLYPGAEITLNATGGNKLMSMGFVEMFRGIAQRIVYTDTGHRRIERLPDGPGAADAPIPMMDVLDVVKYLAAQGFSARRISSDEPGWSGVANARKAVAKYLGREAALLTGFIGAMNRLAGQALKRDANTRTESLDAPRQDLWEVPRGEWLIALQELAGAGLLRWQEGSREIVFIDVPRTQFLRGGWLEEYAWHIVHDERPHDVKLGVEVTTGEGTGNENEFDVLAVHGNQLLFIECKTLRFNPDENDNEIAYRLDSLGRLARGLFGETWLLSARDPTPALVSRAGVNRFRIIGPDELRELRAAVQGWMRGPG